MTADLTRYGAVTAKVRAMYGMRLRGEDYARIAAMRSVGEVADSLRDHPGWGPALAAADTVALRRDRLETVLRRHGLRHLLRLFLYMRREDRAFMRYPILTAEMEQIMRYMRMAAAGSAADFTTDLPDLVRKLSRVKFDLLSSAETYDDLLAAVRNTDFYTSLLRIRPGDGGFPPYLLVEAQMRRSYFRSLAEPLRGRGGAAGELLREAVGIQADWDNITTIERILRFYPSLRPDIFQYLLPAGAHLETIEFKTMIALEDADSLWTLLAKTHYGPFLSGRRDESLEKTGQAYLMSFYRRNMAGGAPSVFMPVAYINLYQNELRNLIHIIESVRYGLAPEVAEKYLVVL